MLEPLGYKPKFANSVMAVLIAYLLNLVIPRSGEVARAATMTKYENIPFEKAFGTIVAERISDIIMLLLILAVVFFFQTDLILSYFSNTNPTRKIVIISLLILGFYLLIKFLKKSNHPFSVKIRKFINGLLEGISTIFKMKKKMGIYFPYHFYLVYVHCYVLGSYIYHTCNITLVF
jgi:uncharacterized protein (TIRG00374 family)